jgi:hypothetical protein
MRLGELLIGAGWAQPALRSTRPSPTSDRGRRLGAILVAYAGVSADDVARGLARQRGVPAALERHLAQRDPALTAVVPAEIAIELAAVPVAWSRGAQGMALVVCFRDPTPDHVAELVRVCGVPIIPAIACEAVIARELAAAYPGAVPREDDDSSVDVNFDDPSSPVFALVDLDDGRVLRDESQVSRCQPPRAAGSCRPRRRQCRGWRHRRRCRAAAGRRGPHPGRRPDSPWSSPPSATPSPTWPSPSPAAPGAAPSCWWCARASPSATAASAARSPRPRWRRC